MNRLIVFLCVSLGVASLLACASTGEVPRRDFVPEGSSPKEFLHYLTQLKRQPNTYTFPGKRPCWITEDDVSFLITRLNSTTPASSVRLPQGSLIRNGSTEGDEAGYLIRGFQMGVYPPDLGSDPLSDQDKSAISDWWKEYRAGRKTLDELARACEAKR